MISHWCIGIRILISLQQIHRFKFWKQGEVKVLFLSPYPYNTAPSQRFRFELFQKSLPFSFIQKTFYSLGGWNKLYTGTAREKIWFLLTGHLRSIFHLFVSANSDIIFVHREITPLGPPIFEWFIAKVLRKRIIFDFDDAIWINDGHDSQLMWWLKCRWKIALICKWSWKVCVGNEYLADFAKKHSDHVVVVPTVVDTDVHKPTPNLEPSNRSQEGIDRRIVLGWTGSHSTLSYLISIQRALVELEQKCDFEFVVIANQAPNFQIPNLKFIKWQQESEVEDLSQIDIGVMPLPDEEWTKGKCGFKLIQYGALEIPSIASPIGVNTSIVKEGENGFLASTHEEWVEKLSLLIENKELRRKLGSAGRQTVVEKYSVEANKEKWLAIFE
jgi:glycosyltransferase involved in cell wall biosynthesis